MLVYLAWFRRHQFTRYSIEFYLMSRGKISIIMMAMVSMLPCTSFADDNSKQNPIPVKQVAERNVVGYLGYPLGTVVRITGVCLDGKRARRKAYINKTLLEIRVVNGKPLECPFVLPFERAAKDVKKPTDGESFDYYAHEWGEFDGIVEIPKALGIDQPIVAHDGFHYRPHITIHKSNAKSQQEPIRTSQ